MAITPVVVSCFSKYLYERDMKFANGDVNAAKFKIKVAIDPSDPAQEKWAKERIAAHKKAGGSAKNCPVKKGNPDWKEDENKFYAQFKTKRQPTIVDCANQDITESSLQVYGGDMIRVMYAVLDQTPTPGAFLRLQKVQLVKKSGSEGGDFDEIEGYVARSGPATDETDDKSAGDEEDF
jgi:hypothetical protein